MAILAIRLFKQWIPKNWNFSRILKLGKEKKTKPSLMPARTYHTVLTICQTTAQDKLE